MKIQRKMILAFLAVMTLLFMGCAGEKTGRTVTGKEYGSIATERVLEDDTRESGTEEEQQEKIWLLVRCDTGFGVMYFMDIDTGKEVQYAYTDGTFFQDKYGGITSLAAFEPGEAVNFSVSEKTGTLSGVQISDDVWRMEDIKDFSADEERGVISFGGSNYSYDQNLLVYSADVQIPLSELTEGNTVRVLGQDKKILSVNITTGLGTVTLRGTELFEDGWLNLDNRTYLKITKDMTIEVAEGVHKLTVANDGYGDTTEITVARGQNLEVDLNTLKGEGPKYCELEFTLMTPETVVLVDGEEVDTDAPIQIKYGTHVLQAKAPGYDMWTRKLVVNSAKAVLVLDLSEQSSSVEEEAVEKDTEEAGEQATEKDSEQDSGEETTDAADVYLDTLSGIMDTLTSTGE